MCLSLRFKLSIKLYIARVCICNIVLSSSDTYPFPTSHAPSSVVSLIRACSCLWCFPAARSPRHNTQVGLSHQTMFFYFIYPHSAKHKTHTSHNTTPQPYHRPSHEGRLIPWEPGKINIATSPPLRSRRISPFIL